MSDRAEVGQRVRSAREALKLSQQDVADATGIPRTALSDVENDRRNLLATELPGLALVLDRSVAWIVGVEKEPARSNETQALAAVALIDALEDRCESCGGVGEHYYCLETDVTRVCGTCGGSGEVLTESGDALLTFLAKYGVRNDWADAEESRQEFDDAGRDAVAAEEADEWNAADRVEAFLDDWDTEYPFDATGILADIPARYTNGLTPTRELTVADLRQVVAERKQLAARVAELEAVDPEAAADIKVAEALARYKAARFCPNCGNPKTSLAHGTRCLSAVKETT
jgi:transcriptional regulator with XRE-family HTH domain